jgi:hypothetical protein
MGRICAEVRVDGNTLWTLFDTGSRNTYISESASRGLRRQTLKSPRKVGLGGRHYQLKFVCILEGRLERKPIDTEAYVIEDLGLDERGRPIDLLFGALAMQKWGIRLIPEEERLDLTHYPREFLEF